VRREEGRGIKRETAGDEEKGKEHMPLPVEHDRQQVEEEDLVAQRVVERKKEVFARYIATRRVERARTATGRRPSEGGRRLST
jgi:hypothetical protein